MKHLYYIAALAATFLTAMPLHAQEEVENEATQQQQTRRRSPQASRGERNDKKDTGLPELTVRAQDMNERLTQEIGERSLDAYYLPAGGLDERAERSALLPDPPDERTDESFLRNLPAFR